jgi:hypothetical protein
MNKKRPGSVITATEEISETDFAKGVRGKYAGSLKKNGYTIRVYRTDGSFTERRVAGKSLVRLDPDVQAHFPASKAVNRALRKLIGRQPNPKRITNERRSD